MYESRGTSTKSLNWWWWCDGAENVFVAHTGPLNINQALYAHYSFFGYCGWLIPLWPKFTNLSPSWWCAMSQSTSRLILVTWTWHGVQCTFTACSIHQIRIWQSPFGMLTNLQQLCDTVMLTWTRISTEWFQHLVQCNPKSNLSMEYGVPKKGATEHTSACESNHNSLSPS